MQTQTTNKRREKLLERRRARKTEISDIDLGLIALNEMDREGPLTRAEIAEVCGCSEQYLKELEERALMKLRRHRAELEACLNELAQA